MVFAFFAKGITPNLKFLAEPKERAKYQKDVRGLLVCGEGPAPAHVPETDTAALLLKKA